MDLVLENEFETGWSEARYIISNGTEITGTLKAGSQKKTDTICLADGCYRFEVTRGLYP